MDDDRLRESLSVTAGARLAVAAFYALLAALALGLAHLARLNPWAGARFEPRAAALGLLTAAPLAAWLALVMTRDGLGFGQLRRATIDLVRPLFAGLTTADILALSTLAGVVEEFLFRGVLQPAAASRWGLPAALLITNLLFAAAHALTPTYAAVTLLIGAYLGAAAALTGNLAVPMIAHAAYDAIALAWILHSAPFSRKGDLPDPHRR